MPLGDDLDAVEITALGTVRNGDQHVFLLKPMRLKACVVPKLKGKALTRAKRSIKAHACSVGKIKRAASRTIKKGHVISQKPKAGLHLKHGAKVNLVVSRGR